MRYFRTYVSILFCCFFVACENTQFKAREQGAVGGAALGAGLGAIVGNQTGDTGAGIAVGAAFGALSGALIGNEIDANNAQIDERERRLSEQQRRIEENKRLIQELRAGGVDAYSTDRGIVVNLPDVLFQFGKSNLTPQARDTAYEIAKTLKNVSGPRRVTVEGHTDSVGSVAYNKRLSEARARSVAHELEREGVSSQNIHTHGFGKSRPIATNSTDAGRQRNRRVEVVIENG